MKDSAPTARSQRAVPALTDLRADKKRDSCTNTARQVLSEPSRLRAIATGCSSKNLHDSPKIFAVNLGTSAHPAIHDTMASHLLIKELNNSLCGKEAA